MSKCLIRFQQHLKNDYVIKCRRNEVMRDIINRYLIKSRLSINEFCFLYRDNIINMDTTLAKINEKDKEIIIIVCSKRTEEKENKTKKADLITNYTYIDTASSDKKSFLGKKRENDRDLVPLNLNENHIESETMIKIKIEETDVNKIIYFLDNTTENSLIMYEHNNLKEVNENNTILIIDGKTVPYTKLFIPKKSGIHSIKLLFKNKILNCAYMFYNCKNIIDIDFSKFNTENVTDMKYMFHGCSGLKSLNLSTFNTQNVTNMGSMFRECSNLTTVNLSSFNTEKITNMGNMFRGCSSLTKLNLSSFNTDNVTYMSFMFYGCSSLKKLNLSSFNTEKVTDMGCIFYGLSSLSKFDLSNFNTEKVKDMRFMFRECSSLTILDLTSFNTKNVTSMGCMFYGCSSLVKLNLTSFNTGKVNSTFKMFDECPNLLSCSCSDKKIVDAFGNNEEI